MSPALRSWAAMTSLPDGSVLMFGGQGTHGSLADTWVFASGVWTPLKPTHSPTPRASASLAYTGSGQPLLFGGRYLPSPGTHGPFLNTTWRPSAS